MQSMATEQALTVLQLCSCKAFISYFDMSKRACQGDPATVRISTLNQAQQLLYEGIEIPLVNP